jgi:DNA (cytosine-5)-methyltransferase 1
MGYKYIDIFAGCGGLSLGLYQSGWEGLFAVEKDYMAFKTLSHNLIEKAKHFCWPKWLPVSHHDIDEILIEYRDKLCGLQGTVDLVAGGPPCQGFSMAGRRRECDKRNRLIHSYIEFVELVKPKVILFENVKGFTQGFKKNDKRGIPYSEIVLNGLKEIGYTDAKGQLIDFSDYGVPQKRERYIIIGTLARNGDNFFDHLHKKKGLYLKGKGLKSKVGVGAAICDLLKSSDLVDCPDKRGFKSGLYSSCKNSYQEYLRLNIENEIIPDSHRFVNHRADAIRIYQKLLKHAERNVNIGGKLKEKYGITKRNITVLDSKQPSPTLLSIPDDYVHYCEPRVLTVREYARIQSFPDWFEFKGNYTTGGKRRAMEVPRYTQIANAIPPLFAEYAGTILKELLD